jgi:hypothetical protein
MTDFVQLQKIKYKYPEDLMILFTTQIEGTTLHSGVIMTVFFF